MREPGSIPLDVQIAVCEKCLRDALRYLLSGSDWERVDAAGLIRAARELELLPSFCSRLERLLKEREASLRFSRILSGGTTP